MKTVTAGRPIISIQDIQSLVEERYTVEKFACKLYRSTFNYIYLLENSTSKYIFKIRHADSTDLEELKAEIELLAILQLNAVRVAAAIADNTGVYIQYLEHSSGICYGVLYVYAPGITHYYLDEKQVATFAKELAKMHNITAGLQLNSKKKEYNLDTLFTYPLAKIIVACTGIYEDLTWLNEMSALARDKLAQFFQDNMSYGYCHFDLLPTNFHFDEDGQIMFYDFELSGKGHLINDLVSFYSHYFLLIIHNQGTREEADRAFFLLVKNYTKIRPITSIEMGAFPYLGFAFWIFHLSHEYVKNNFVLEPEYLKQRLLIIKTWVNWYLQF